MFGNETPNLFPIQYLAVRFFPLPDLSIERLAVESQDPRRQRLVVPDRFQHVSYVSPLDLLHGDQVAWARQHGKCNVFCLALGHDNEAWSNSAFRDVLGRGIQWSAGRRK